MSEESEKKEEKTMVATIVSGLFQLGLVIWREVSEFKTANAEQRKKNEERSRQAFETMRNSALTFFDKLDENDREADAIAAETDKRKAAAKVVEKLAVTGREGGETETVPEVASNPPKLPNE